MKKLSLVIFLALAIAPLNVSQSNTLVAATQQVEPRDCKDYARQAANKTTSFWSKLFQTGEWELNYNEYYALCITTPENEEILLPVVL